MFQPGTPNSLDDLCEVINSEGFCPDGTYRKRPRPIDLEKVNFVAVARWLYIDYVNLYTSHPSRATANAMELPENCLLKIQ